MSEGGANAPRGGAGLTRAGKRMPEGIEFLRENLEAFAIAIAMALVIKHFCVEAFKIPTSSMSPTLFGDEEGPGGVGDRILVDKFAYLFEPPGRWDVPVFRYPLNRSRNFIKRIAGLPGETLRIWRGDVWVKDPGQRFFRIATKPPRVREQLYTSVFPPPPPEVNDSGREGNAFDAESYFRTEGAPGAFRTPSAARLEFVGGPRAALRSHRPLYDSSYGDPWGGSGEYVRDVRVRVRLEPGPRLQGQPGGIDPASDVQISWRADPINRATLVIAAAEGASHVRFEREGVVIERRPVPARLRPGAAVEVGLEYVDGEIHASVDGEFVLDSPIRDGRQIDDAASAPTGAAQQLRLSAVGHPVVFADLRMDRDLYYENSFANSRFQRDGVEIPEDCYFMLGDNTSSSSDSRKWQLTVQRLRDGTEIRHDYRDENVHWPVIEPGDGGEVWKRAVDEFGVMRRWRESDEDPTHRMAGKVDAPFVPRELIVGRAFLVFWPVTPDFPGRLHFTH